MLRTAQVANISISNPVRPPIPHLQAQLAHQRIFALNTYTTTLRVTRRLGAVGVVRKIHLGLSRLTVVSLWCHCVVAVMSLWCRCGLRTRARLERDAGFAPERSIFRKCAVDAAGSPWYRCGVAVVSLLCRRGLRTRSRLARDAGFVSERSIFRKSAIASADSPWYRCGVAVVRGHGHGHGWPGTRDSCRSEAFFASLP